MGHASAFSSTCLHLKGARSLTLSSSPPRRCAEFFPAVGTHTCPVLRPCPRRPPKGREKKVRPLLVTV